MQAAATRGLRRRMGCGLSIRGPRLSTWPTAPCPANDGSRRGAEGALAGALPVVEERTAARWAHARTVLRAQRPRRAAGAVRDRPDDRVLPGRHVLVRR